MESHETTPAVEVKPANPAKIRKIWTIAGIIGAITAIEFVFAYSMPKGVLLYTIFICLTFIKAGYIVMEFMHLKDEHKSLFWSIVLPCVFLVWLVIALLNEGGAILEVLSK
ncbi:hypothetical protein FUAX_28850 [Fulvitalea axinellae]|uniref:Cytochrome C oxidase subunit IV n=1 Tax=Fulvitalea axinellae TaxID=1182444 RepID=A0AAU9CJW8_9BACT|nr:hypothetical protein FUAX_28850 [Fulvitalea axinellae]